MGQVDLSIITPSYNGGLFVRRHHPPLMDYLAGLGCTFEVIVVDDGSHDQGLTHAIARELGLRYAQLPRNMGKGAAVRRGMQIARGDVCIYTDIDIPFEFSSIKTAYERLSSGRFDIIAGDRSLPEASYYPLAPPLRRLASAVASTIVGRLVVPGWYDTQCGFKGFRAKAAADVFSRTIVNRFAFDVEVLFLARKLGYEVERLPVKLRCNEESTVRIIRDSAVFVRDLFRIHLHDLLGRYDT